MIAMYHKYSRESTRLTTLLFTRLPGHGLSTIMFTIKVRLESGEIGRVKKIAGY